MKALALTLLLQQGMKTKQADTQEAAPWQVLQRKSIQMKEWQCWMEERWGTAVAIRGCIEKETFQ